MAEELRSLGQGGSKLYQDQLYGAKVLTPLAVAIIDTPEFQRLAGLKQLGFANFAYRGAQHTRFCHSIGTYFLSRTIMRRIVQNHERLRLEHPGEQLPDRFSIFPSNAEEDQKKTTYQSRWRGLTEVISIAALLHDISHVPFGHTLEDEFAGIYEKHDMLGGPRLYILLFSEQSQIKRLFGKDKDRWIEGRGSRSKISNEDLLRLIYLILSWKEKIDPPQRFKAILKTKLAKVGEEEQVTKDRLEQLQEWHNTLVKKEMFEPFMSDIVGNTICADLLDYLPRDRMNLGMEFRMHGRLQRYLTIRKGQLYDDEGRRLSIMVTRHHRGAQRRDVATAVLDIMRERYEMSERVYYHHKKAAFSAMLAKLVELAAKDKPADDEDIYPAPWTKPLSPSHVVHFNDTTFIDYLGHVHVSRGDKELQRNLYLGIRYDRREVYRTLLVVDSEVVRWSPRSITYFEKELRMNEDGELSNVGRQHLEKDLAASANAPNGKVLVYCPDPHMQAKEVDARLEIIEDKVLPLRVQREAFAYYDDVRVLEQYYQQLWLIYIFVSPELFENEIKCKAIVDKFCERYCIEPIIAYKKVRQHQFTIGDINAERVLEPLEKFFKGTDLTWITFEDTPYKIIIEVISSAAKDQTYLRGLKDGKPASILAGRIAALFDLSILMEEKVSRQAENSGSDVLSLEAYIGKLSSGEESSLKEHLAARGSEIMFGRYEDYKKALLDIVEPKSPKE